ncbi:MAG: NAD(P)/FAD-dependent oxidoreductase [Desulfobacteraceae bacterium]|nr:NAD(P)/FAD-dependent oxidoreductase [Desulfobacteraceae bacterium]
MPRKAAVIGSGPNGLAAAIELARAGWEVTVYESRDTPGGGARTAELTLPGFRHDICSAIHPLAVSSPAFASYGLKEAGLEWLDPELPLAHPFDDGTAAVLARPLAATADALGPDGSAWRELMAPFVREWDQMAADLLGPPLRLPANPSLLVRLALPALQPALSLANRKFHSPQTRALFGGIAAHSMLPLDQRPSAVFGLVLAIAGHARGWPLPRGGSQAITEALIVRLHHAGGEIVTGREIRSLDELPESTAVLFDLTPRQIVRIAGASLPSGYLRRLQKYRYGMGVFKIDWALSEPVPWRAEACRRAGTVHVGGSLEEIAEAERAAWRGYLTPRPFLILAQQSLFDPSRAPAGRHTLWGYCHMRHHSEASMVSAMEHQIERFAPGFRSTILARHTMNAAQMEEYNPNYVGGDINGGVQDLRQLLARPAFSLDPYAMPAEGLYICSAATPPGGGVHGLGGHYAAQSVLRKYGRE